MILPNNCLLTDTRFIINDVKDITLDLNGSTLESNQLYSAIFVHSSNPNNITSNITIKNGFIKGYGTAIYVIKNLTSNDYTSLINNPEAYYPTIQSTAPNNIIFENITINSPKGTGIYVGIGSSYVTINNSTITEARGPAIYLDTSTHSNTISNCTITNSGYLNPDGSNKIGRGKREGIAIDGSYNNYILNNIIHSNARGGIHLYSNCGEHVTTDLTYVPRIFDAEYNTIKNNNIYNNNDGGAIEIGKRVDWNLEDWDCAKPLYVSYLTYKFYYDNSGYNKLIDNIGDGDILIRTDNNLSENNQQSTIIHSTVRLLANEPLINNTVL